MSPARCRSPTLVFRYTPKPMSAPSERNCHLQGRGAVLRRGGEGTLRVAPAPRGRSRRSPEDAAGEQDLVLDLVGRAPVDHDRVFVLLRQLVPHVVTLGHVPPVVDLEGMEDVGVGELPRSPKEPHGGSSYLAGALGVPIRVRQCPPVLHRDLRGVDVLLQDLLPVGCRGRTVGWGGCELGYPPCVG